MPFSLENATPGQKRAAETEISSPAKAKIPKVSQLKKETPREKPEKITTNGPVKICVYKYSDSAGDLWNHFKDVQDIPLYQIQMDHDARQFQSISISTAKIVS